MNIIIFTDADGNVNEMVPAPGFTLTEVMEKDVPDGVTAFITDTTNLPDEYFREAWEEDGAVVSVNLDGAKQIALIDVRTVADKTIGFIQRSFLLNEDAGGVTQDDVTNAYEQAKQDIENATDVPFVKAAVEVFKSTYDIVED